MGTLVEAGMMYQPELHRPKSVIAVLNLNDFVKIMEIPYPPPPMIAIQVLPAIYNAFSGPDSFSPDAVLPSYQLVFYLKDTHITRDDYTQTYEMTATYEFR